jgi:hypothetical protein
MFLFTDAHVADEGFLELINNMLTSGMVPALYDDGEKDILINSVMDEVSAKTPVYCYIYLWQQAPSCIKQIPHRLVGHNPTAKIQRGAH